MVLNYYLISTGCRTNQADGEGLAFLLSNEGFIRVKKIEEADYLIISGCVVTENSEKEVLKIIRRAKKLNKNIKIVLVGCFAERQSLDPISSISYDYLIPMGKRKFIGKILKGEGVKDFDHSFFFSPAIKMEGKSRFFFKIQEGCDGECSYCYIRFVRGKPRSLDPNVAIEHVRSLIKSGVKEIVFCGIRLGSYGKEIGHSLSKLLKEVEKIEGEFRYRLSSIEPWDITPELIETLKDSKKFCNFFHIPLQSGDNEVLRIMKRPYDINFYLNLIKNLKKIFENPRIGADIIVGFPAEGKKEFENTLNFLKNCPLDYLHIFTYSPRPSHPFPSPLKKQEIKERYNILKKLDLQLREKDKALRIGKISEALTTKNFGILKENYYCILEENLKENVLVKCKIKGWEKDKAIIEII